MSKGNWGGSAAGGGLDFQAAVSALCMVHMARGTPLGWFPSGDDTPLSVSAETGGAGDDIALQLANSNVLEVQAKRKLTANSELWDALIALCHRAHEDATFWGVLAVGPTTSVAIRDQLARDIIRFGQGRTDDLSQLAVTLTEMLSAASIPLLVCNRVRIQTVHVLEQDGASAQLALAHLAHITTQPEHAWERLKAEGLRLIKLRGRQDAVSIAGILPGLRASTSGPLAPALVAKQHLDWTLSTTNSFTIPAVDTQFSFDDDWLELDAYTRDKEVSLGNLEQALTRYHKGHSRKAAGPKQDKFSAETLGYFVRQCVVVAGPGMGKTLLLRRMARLLARKGEPSLLVRLRPLAERMRAGDTFLEAALHIGLDASPFTPQDLRMLGMQNLTLLLDGLDESGSEQDEIAKAAIALTTSYPKCRIVFTTRPIGYETARLSTWRHYELASIESSDAKRSVEHLVDAATGIENAKVKEATAAATSHMDYTRDYRFSANSPLLIALLASLALNEVIAAATREGLYEQLFRLIERVSANKLGTTSVAPAVLNAFLQQLGWQLTEEPYADVKQVLASCAQRLAVELGERPLRAQAICDEALKFWEMAGFVERVRFKASEALTFVHKTFGEFAAAQYVLSRSPQERQKLLEAIEPEQLWNEVVVFTSALGLGPDLVQFALVRAREDSSEIFRLLRWARHSRDPLKADLSEPVLQLAWEIIGGPHSGQALKTGIELVEASGKLLGAGVSSESYCSHQQWWTALVGWACFVQANPDRLDFPALLAFMESYAESADTRKVTGGFELNDPVSQLWELLLLASTKEAVRRGIGSNEQIFIDRLQESLGTRSMGFLRVLTFILKEADVKVELPVQEDLFSKYFKSEYFEKSGQDTIALLEAIAEAPPSDTVPVNAPLLHLSAFWYGTGLMNMELSAAELAAKDSGGSDVRQIVCLAARLSSYDYGQLIAEAQTKIRTLKADDGLVRIFDGLLSVDAPMESHGNRDSSTRPMLARALLHPSEWIVYLAANLAERLLTVADIVELVPQVLSESKGLGMAAAAHLAIHFLGKERARELIVARLKRPLNAGCQHLFRYVADVWIPELDVQTNEILKPALFYGPRTAKAALKLAHACSEPHRKTLSPLLNEAYDYWLQHEGPYPNKGGVIPESPRGEILTLMIEVGAVGDDLLFEAAKDPRSEVSQLAKKALLLEFSMSEVARNELVRRLQSGEALDSLLRDCLRTRIPFSEQDVQSIAELLESERPQTRYAAADILDLQYLPPSVIEKWVGKLSSDSYQHLRDKGHERLTALHRSLSDEATVGADVATS